MEKLLTRIQTAWGSVSSSLHVILLRSSVLVASARSHIAFALRALANFYRCYPTISVVLLIIGLFLIAVFGEWVLLAEKTKRALQAFDEIKDSERRVEAYGKLISAVGLAVAAPIGLLGAMLAFWRTINQHRDGVLAAQKLEAESYAKAAEAFAKAVDHLGSEKASIRMGAVLALEALGKSTPRLLSQTIEILCAYVREMHPVKNSNSPKELQDSNSSRDRCPTDIELIFEIISRLKQYDNNNSVRIDLSFSDLRMVNLPMANLRGANLSGSNLRGAVLSKAKLQESSLINTDLSESILDGACLYKADLSIAKFRRASMIKSDLHKSNLMLAKLEGAILKDSNLRNSKLYEADFNSTDLCGADLSGSVMRKAEFSEADLTGAKLNGAKMKGAIFFDTLLPDGRTWSGTGYPPGFERHSAPSLPVE